MKELEAHLDKIVELMRARLAILSVFPTSK
jgi:hypothetical protein